MKLDDTKLSDALRSIHAQLGRDEVSLIIDIARLASSADGRMDLTEMSTIARISKILYGMAGGIGGEANVPVPSELPDKGRLADLGAKLATTGARELAYACAMLVMQTDLKVTDQEAELGTRLVEVLQLERERAATLAAMTEALVRG